MKTSKARKLSGLLFVLALLAWPAAHIQATAPTPSGEKLCKSVEVNPTADFFSFSAIASYMAGSDSHCLKYTCSDAISGQITVQGYCINNKGPKGFGDYTYCGLAAAICSAGEVPGAMVMVDFEPADASFCD